MDQKCCSSLHQKCYSSLHQIQLFASKMLQLFASNTALCIKNAAALCIINATTKMLQAFNFTLNFLGQRCICSTLQLTFNCIYVPWHLNQLLFRLRMMQDKQLILFMFSGSPHWASNFSFSTEFPIRSCWHIIARVRLCRDCLDNK